MLQLTSKLSSTTARCNTPKHHLRLFARFKDALNARRSPRRRARRPTRSGWRVNAWVKKGILLGFRMGAIVDMSIDSARQPFFDKATYPVRQLTAQRGVRIVPGGSSIRDGCYIGRGVTCMPPMYINVGAYVDDGTMVDSHALVGSCAQVGKSCHVSAAAQIGGVLEPVGALPVIIEDEVLVGGNSGVYEGTVVKRRAVLGTGVILNRSTPVYDLVHGTVYSRHRRRSAHHSRRCRRRRRLPRRHPAARARSGASRSTPRSSSSTAIQNRREDQTRRLSSITRTVSRAARSHVYLAARSLPPPGASPVQSLRSAPATASSSSGSNSTAHPPARLRSGSMSLQASGTPAAIASSTGIPNPSKRDGYTAPLARRNNSYNSPRSTHPFNSTDSPSPNSATAASTCFVANPRTPVKTNRAPPSSRRNAANARSSLS